MFPGSRLTGPGNERRSQMAQQFALLSETEGPISLNVYEMNGENGQPSNEWGCVAVTENGTVMAHSSFHFKSRSEAIGSCVANLVGHMIGPAEDACPPRNGPECPNCFGEYTIYDETGTGYDYCCLTCDICFDTEEEAEEDEH
jgi:hypothetical protein